MSLEQLPLSQIRPAADQPRKTFYQESLEDLAASIKERGVLEPIVVRPVSPSPGKSAVYLYEVVMGERRFRASKMAGLIHIPAIVKKYTDEEAAADALLENFQREDLNPVEKARAIQGLLKFMSHEQVCRTLGVSETTTRRLLQLLDLPPHVQAELIARPGAEEGRGGGGSFTEGHARALLAMNEDASTQMRLVIKVKKERVGVGDLEQLIAGIKRFPLKKEVLLHVPFSIGEQLLRSLGAGEERKRPYRAQTAKDHLRVLDKRSADLADLLDERIVEYLALEEMNQLLATMAHIGLQVETFTAKVREAIENRDYGFTETYLHCPLCGRIELVGSLRCSTCGTVLRRCYDCGHYDRSYERCAKLDVQVYVSEAESPKEHSRSYRCPDYKPKFTPQGIKPMRLKMA